MADNPFDSVFPDDQPQSEETDRPAPSEPPANEDAQQPDSAAAIPSAPRIVAETPLGGLTRRVTPAAEEGEGDVEAAAAPEPDTEPEADEDSAVAVEPVASEEPAVVSLEAAEEPATPESDESEEPLAESEAAEDDEPDSPVERLFGAAAALVDAVLPGDDEDAEPEPEDVEETEAESEADTAVLERPEAEAPSVLAPGAVSSRMSGDITAVSRPTQPVTPPTSEPEPVEGVDAVTDKNQWDDDISPELAALLFAGDKPTSTPARETRPAEPTEPAAPAPTPTPHADLPPREPILLTATGQAKQLYLFAEGNSAPAPDAPLAGKVRYTRVEEPLKDDQGQRVRETWEYYKPNYPALAGRLVKEVRSEEITYADGSWFWQYERAYTDKGRDKREVRANTDHTFIERKDEVSTIDPETNKRSQHKEMARLIFAAPENNEKRGGFLSSLFGGDDRDEKTQPNVWREASSKEARQARKAGGAAF